MEQKRKINLKLTVTLLLSLPFRDAAWKMSEILIDASAASALKILFVSTSCTMDTVEIRKVVSTA